MSADFPRHRRLTVVLGARDHAGHHLLATELLAQVRSARLWGATLLEATGGAPGPDRPEGAFEATSLALVVVDEAEAIDRFVHDERALLSTTTVFLDDVVAFRAAQSR